MHKHLILPSEKDLQLPNPQEGLENFDNAHSVWNTIKELNDLTIGDVVAMPDRKLYLKSSGEEIEI